MKRRQLLVSLAAAVVAFLTTGTLYILTNAKMAQTMPQESYHSGIIQGRVLDAEGRPVSGVIVYAEEAGFLIGIRPSAETDDEGKFQISGLSSGTYTVYGVKEEDGYPEPSFAIYAPDPAPLLQVSVHEQQIAEVTVHLGPRAAKLTGRIVDARTNEPINNSRITLRSVDNPVYSFSTSPDTEGEFMILIPSAPCTIEVEASGYENWQYGRLNPNDQADALQLASGDTRELTIALRPSR